MANQKYIDFLTRIISNTKGNKLAWYYLDDNRSLYEGMEWTRTTNGLGMLIGEKEKIGPDFDRDNSFYVTIRDVYIVLLVRNSNPANMYIVPNSYKKVVALTADEYGEYITRLLNIVQSRFRSGESFIDDYLQSSND